MCSDRVVVRLRDVSKSYRIYKHPVERLKQILWGQYRDYGEVVHALQNVNLELRKGEVLGIVGRNGAGKSTLLQVLCGTLTPTSGTVEVEGRVAALLELGAGFNPDFTGRENVFLYGTVLGLTQQEIESRFDEIVAFSGIGDYINQPVKTYSSGMYVRLAFSIATSVEPDVLVVDEALSVGDGEFARRSFDRIMSLRDRGTTILFCSHSLYQVEALCTRALWLDHGRVQCIGAPATVIAAYNQALDQEITRHQSVGTFPPSAVATPPAPRGYARIERVIAGTSTQSGRELSLVTGQSDLWIEVRFACDTSLPPPSVAVTIHAMDGRTICSAGTHLHAIPVRVNADGRGIARVRFPSFPLLKGRYFVSAHLLCERGIHLYQTADQIATIDVAARDVAQGIVWVPNEWALLADESSTTQSDLRLHDNVKIDDPLAWLSKKSRELSHGEELHNLPPQLPYPERLLPRFGFEKNTSGAWIKTKTPRWHLAWITKDQVDEWTQLFERSFGHPMPKELLLWKYRDTEVLGLGAYTNSQLIAFYGGMPRQAIWGGKTINVVQIGDVMVEPAARGVLTRHGPFQLVAATFLEQRIGHGQQFLLGFGFPSAIAMRLAQRLGLYAPVDRIVELSWPARIGRARWRFLVESVTLNDLNTIDELWMQMAASLPDSIIGTRDGAYIRSRYLNHPTIRYSAFVVRHRWSGQAAGVVILNDRKDEGLEIVDIIGPKHNWPHLVRISRHIAADFGRSRLFLWITASHVHLLDIPDTNILDMDLHVPTNVWSSGPTPDDIKNRWLLMGGDSDFR